MAKAVLWRAALLGLGLALFTAACAAPVAAPSAPPPDDGLVITILTPAAGKETATLVVQVTDRDGAPVTDATVALEGDMNHAGMVPVIADAVTDDADGVADGRYTLPFRFTMLGDWILTVTVTRDDGSTATRTINAQVRDDAVAIEGAPAVAAHDEHAEDEHAHDGKHAEVVHIHDVRARPAPLVGGNSAVYFLLHNPTDEPVTLIGGSTPAAARVEIHETVMQDGVMRMRELADGLTVAAGETVALEPGGLHVMLIDLVKALEVGDELELTLVFDTGEEIVTQVPVKPIEGSTGGHRH